MSRRVVAAVAAVLLVGGSLAACGASNSDPEIGEVSTIVNYVNLPDGRKVLCVYQYGYQKGGPSCDWVSAGSPR
jgi:hypothetical protein